MFTNKTKTETIIPTTSGSVSLICAGTTINGNVESNADIRIDGNLKGNLYCKAKILIGPAGVIEGDITGQYAEILGRVQGNIKMQDLLHLRGKAIMQGDIHAAKLQIEPSVSFNGQCHMGANVVELNKEMAKAVNE